MSEKPNIKCPCCDEIFPAEALLLRRVSRNKQA